MDKNRENPDLEPFLKPPATKPSILLTTLRSFTTLFECPRDL